MFLVFFFKQDFAFLPGLAWNSILLFMSPAQLGLTDVPHHSWLPY
jgi:hypothetical protein